MPLPPLKITEGSRIPKLIAELTALKHGAVTVGFHADAKRRQDGSATNAQVAAAHEFGTPTIPRRPFLAPALDEGKKVIGDAQTTLAGLVLDGKMSAEDALARLGELGVTLVQEKIRSNVPPPLKPATTEAKGSSNSLINTGEMLRAASYEVDMTGGSGG